MDDTLFYAILSMDSYNRGYDAGIEIDEEDEIGNATIIESSSVLGTRVVNEQEVHIDQSIGFYALAYDLGADQTVISIRGTNHESLAQLW
jgi:hypothetical protein